MRGTAAEMGRAALLAGATGFVGANVLDGLLSAPSCERVIALGRRALDRTDPKLTVQVVDFESLAEETGSLPFGQIDDVYLCLGTTLKAAGSKERFRRVDQDYTVAIARRARHSGATRVGLVSSVGADANAASFYLRVKGETERDVRALGYETLVIARPSFLVGERSEQRPGERIATVLTGVVSPVLLGSFRRYRPVDAREVAATLIRSVAEGRAGERILYHDDFASR